MEPKGSGSRPVRPVGSRVSWTKGGFLLIWAAGISAMPTNSVPWTPALSHLCQDGLHVITVEGTIDDIWGHTWTGGGTYDVHVGRVLALDTAVLPGMHFRSR